MAMMIAIIPLLLIPAVSRMIRIIVAIPRSAILVILAVRRKGRHSGYEHNGCGQNRNLLFHTNSSLLLL